MSKYTVFDSHGFNDSQLRFEGLNKDNIRVYTEEQTNEILNSLKQGGFIGYTWLRYIYDCQVLEHQSKVTWKPQNKFESMRDCMWATNCILSNKRDLYNLYPKKLEYDIEKNDLIFVKTVLDVMTVESWRIAIEKYPRFYQTYYEQLPQSIKDDTQFIVRCVLDTYLKMGKTRAMLSKHPEIMKQVFTNLVLREPRYLNFSDVKKYVDQETIDKVAELRKTETEKILKREKELAARKAAKKVEKEKKKAEEAKKKTEEEYNQKLQEKLEGKRTSDTDASTSCIIN